MNSHPTNRPSIIILQIIATIIAIPTLVFAVGNIDDYGATPERERILDWGYLETFVIIGKWVGGIALFLGVVFTACLLVYYIVTRRPSRPPEPHQN